MINSKQSIKTDQEKQAYENYSKFFLNEVQEFKNSYSILKIIPKQVLNYHKIEIIDQNSLLFEKLSKFDDIYISVRKYQFNGLIYLIDVILGYFHLTIHLLNLQRTADQQDNQIQRNKIGKGGFGAVRAINVNEKQFAIKRIYFKTKLNTKEKEQHLIDLDSQKNIHMQIKKAIREYSICKICSMLKIGPKLIFSDQFDLIIFNDCVEFHMQLCEVPNKAHNFLIQKQIPFEKFNADLKQCLFKLHLLKIIHRDVKPQNILYSSDQNRFILADFGLTQIVQEQIWQKTRTSYAGTLKYSSNQLLQLYKSQSSGYVNLYLNDIHSLNMILLEWQNLYENIQNIQNKLQNKQLSRNSMSFVESFSHHHTYEDYSQSQVKDCSCSGGEGYFQQSSIQSNRNSIINTGSSIPILSTNNTNTILGPIKYSSEINFYQSQAIYYIYHNFLNSPLKNLTIQTIKQIGDDLVRTQMKDEIIKFQIIEHLSITFFPEIMFKLNSQELIVFNLKNNFRNSIRILGPDSNETKQKFKRIIESEKINKDLMTQNQKSILNYLSPQKEFKKQNFTNQKQFEINKILKNLYTSVRDLIKSLENLAVLIKRQRKISDYPQFYSVLKRYVQIVTNSNQSLLIVDTKQINLKLESVFKMLQFDFEFDGKIHKKSQFIKINQILQTEISKIQKNNINLNQNNSSLHLLRKQLKQDHRTLKLLIKVYRIFTNDKIELLDIYCQKEQDKLLLLQYIFHYFLKKIQGQFFAIQNNLLQFVYEECKKYFLNLEIKVRQNKELTKQQIDNYIKLKYFFIKYELKCTKNYQKALQTLENLQNQLLQHSKLYNQTQKYKQFYQDFFIDIKISILYQLQQYQLSKEVIIQFINKKLLFQFKKKNEIKNQKFLSLQFKNFQNPTHIIYIIKKFADIQLQHFYSDSRQNSFQLITLKKLYLKCYNFINQNYNLINFSRLIYQLLNNLIIIDDRLNNLNEVMKWIDFAYDLFKNHQIKDSQKQLYSLSRNYIQFMIKYKMNSISEEQQKTKITHNQKFNQKLNKVIETYVKVKIKSVYKFQIFSFIQQSNLIRSGFKNIHDLEINFFNFDFVNNLASDCLLLKKKFLKVYQQNLPFMEFNYRNISLDISVLYCKLGYNLQAIQFFWNWAEKLIQYPHFIKNKEFQYLNLFIDILIRTKSNSRRAWKFIRKFIYYIPPSEFIIRKQTYSLYLKIVQELKPENNKLEQKWIKQLTKNSFQKLLSRQFYVCQIFQQNQQQFFTNRLQKKWIKKI